MSLLDVRTAQRFLIGAGVLVGPVDGVSGKGTKSASRALLAKVGITNSGWGDDRVSLALDQYILSQLGFNPGTIDGFIGPQTKDALERYQNVSRDREPPADSVSHLPTVWPRERDLMKFYGPVGQNQVSLTLPYKMRLAWDVSKVVTRIQCHAKVHDSLGRIFQSVLEHYGEADIHALGLDMFGGCLNVRPKKGGTSYSTHSWGIAIDMDPEHNQLRWGRDRARLAKSPEYTPFWQAVESEGWVSLGREKNFDWMHFQAARL